MANIIRLYACGGAATDIAAELLRNHESILRATDNLKFEVRLVDNSNSNQNKHRDVFDKHQVNLFVTPGMDGAGQVRKDANISAAQPHLKLMVEDLEPARLNIILHSASGGSGSTLGPALARNLLEADQEVFVAMIGDRTTRNWANNTAGLIGTYENFAVNVLERPIVASYFENAPGVAHAVVNANVIDVIEQITVLFSGNIHGIDKADLHNLLRYTKITDVEPHLALLSTRVVNGNDFKEINEEFEDRNVVGAARISNQSMSVEMPGIFRMEGTAGDADSEMTSRLYVVEDGYFPNVVADLKEIVKLMDAKLLAKKSSNQKTIDLSGADENGMVF